MKLPIDTAAWEAKGLIFGVQGGKYRFVLPGLTDVVDAVITGEEIELHPERSSLHKALLNAISA
jgi:hypothetical protein